MATEAFLNLQCAAWSDNIDKASLHTADPGDTGANIDGAKVDITWAAVDDGATSTTITFEDRTGDWTHIGFWADTVFRTSKVFIASLPAAGDVIVLINHSVTEVTEG